jgi:hypothetical protein
MRALAWRLLAIGGNVGFSRGEKKQANEQNNAKRRNDCDA